ncbi:hypothetical protein BUALT_Bualt07G0010900 [Buddleja alternifolia]|uniref:Zinc finger GRF-type domain-containing protein n=1 Tax=Buddleja alternifolia TaxID=168488 RepID=A0AAV6X8H3_9LAMI|nr:hypothetical protein BUALT_Bualt07G0010900 [Buddleja alternifolia]
MRSSSAGSARSRGSSSHSSHFHVKKGIDTCGCGHRLITQTSLTRKNPGRRFKACPVRDWIISAQFGKMFTFLDCQRHVKKVQKRHRVFKWLVNMAGVLYDQTTNTIIEAAFVWDHICKEQPFAYAYMTEGDPKWRELQIIFYDAPNSPQLFVDNVINISSTDDEEDTYIVQNGGVMFGPVVHGIPVFDIPSGESDDPINLPFPQSNNVVNVSSHDTFNSDADFWKDVYEVFASETGSETYGDNNNDDIFLKDKADVHLLENEDFQTPSPISSIKSIEDFMTPSSSESSSPTFGP